MILKRNLTYNNIKNNTRNYKICELVYIEKQNTYDIMPLGKRCDESAYWQSQKTPRESAILGAFLFRFGRVA